MAAACVCSCPHRRPAPAGGFAARSSWHVRTAIRRNWLALPGRGRGPKPGPTRPARPRPGHGPCGRRDLSQISRPRDCSGRYTSHNVWMPLALLLGATGPRGVQRRMSREQFFNQRTNARKHHLLTSQPPSAARLVARNAPCGNARITYVDSGVAHGACMRPQCPLPLGIPAHSQSDRASF